MTAPAPDWEPPREVHHHQAADVRGIDQAAALKALAVGVFRRVVADMTGKILKANKEDAVVARAEALAWVQESGGSFRFWCLVAGVDPDWLRDRLLTVGEPSTGRSSRLPGDGGADER